MNMVSVITRWGTILCGDDDMARYYREGYEPEVEQAIRSYVKPGMYCFDIGAHVGYFTTLIAELCRGAGGRVVAYEPDQESCFMLRENVGRQRHVEVFCMACGETNHREFLIRDFVNTGMSKIRHSTPDGRTGSSCYVRALRSHCLSRSPDFIKIDVQGDDVSVLKGLLPYRAQAGIIEVWPEGLEEREQSVESLMWDLDEMGYDAHRLEPDDGRLFWNLFITRRP